MWHLEIQQKLNKAQKHRRKTVDAVWTMFAESDFANLSAYSDHGSGSELLAKYPVREKIMQREGK